MSTTNLEAQQRRAAEAVRTLRAVDEILKFSSALTPAQCAVLEDNADEALRYIARELERTGGAASSAASDTAPRSGKVIHLKFPEAKKPPQDEVREVLKELLAMSAAGEITGLIFSFNQGGQNKVGFAGRDCSGNLLSHTTSFLSRQLAQEERGSGLCLIAGGKKSKGGPGHD